MIGAITRIIGLLAVIVVLFHDGIVLGVGQVTADQDAQLAARAAAQSYVQNSDSQRELSPREITQKAYDAAALAVASKGTNIDPATVTIDPGLDMVTVTGTRDTSTMMAGHFHWFDRLTHPSSVGSASIADAPQ